MKVIVAHPQQQHSYRLATALERRGELGKYATTVYMRPGSLTSLVAKFLPPFWRKKATGRHCDDLPDSDVVQFNEARGLMTLFCHNIPFANAHYDTIRRSTEDAFADKVAKLAASENADAVIGYDGCSASLFERVGQLSPRTVRIADMSAANALYLRTVYERDAILKPEYSDSLKGWNRIWDSVDVERTKRELAATDAFLCGSHFVANSLSFSGISMDRCEICHYGVDTEAFPFRERSVCNQSEPLTFVYLGQVSEHKGISWLFEAFSKIEPAQARLICVGKVNLPESITSRLPPNIEFRGMVQHDEVSELLLSSDVMLFPSLGDGFPLSIMEGFASGLPVVCTENTGAADCILEGINGFVVPIQDSDALKNSIQWFLSNKEQIPRMAKAARESVLDYTWDKYYEKAADSVERLVEKYAMIVSDKTVVYLLGDSITQGLGSKKVNFAGELAHLLGDAYEIVNLAYTGTTIDYALKLLDDGKIVPRERESVCVILYGNVDAQIRPSHTGKLFPHLPKRFQGGGDVDAPAVLFAFLVEARRTADR